MLNAFDEMRTEDEKGSIMEKSSTSFDD